MVDFHSQIGCDESGSSLGRGWLRLAHERGSLRDRRKIALGSFEFGGRILHKRCTDLKQFPVAGGLAAL